MGTVVRERTEEVEVYRLKRKRGGGEEKERPKLFHSGEKEKSLNI